MSNFKSYRDIYENLIIEDNEEEKNEISGDIELKFSPNLASEFTRTVNEFTAVCAKMVKEKNINKDLADKFNDLYSKIKNLVEAAKNS